MEEGTSNGDEVHCKTGILLNTEYSKRFTLVIIYLIIGN